MAVSLSYDTVLSRVRVTADGVTPSLVINTNPDFEADASDWTPQGAGVTVTRSTVRAYAGSASGALTVGGGANPAARTGLRPGLPGQRFRMAAWVWSTAAIPAGVHVAFMWYDGGGAEVRADVGATVPIPAATWTYLEHESTGQAGAAQIAGRVRFAGTPAGGQILWFDVAELSRIAADGSTGARVERSTNGLAWTTVRAGQDAPVQAGAIALDDYEFTPGVSNTYRVVTEVGGTQSASITPVDARTWLKSLARPFLNRPVVVDGPLRPEVTRSARGGYLPIVDRTLPVGVTGARGSQQWTMTILCASLAEADDVDMLLTSGDILLVQVPPDCPVPGGYVTVGDTAISPVDRRSGRYRVSIPCTQAAAPGPDVIGSTATWQTVLSTYATWDDLMTAHPTWQSVMELIGNPEDVIVP